MQASSSNKTAAKERGSWLRLLVLLAAVGLLLYGLPSGAEGNPTGTPPSDSTWLICAGLAFPLLLVFVWLPGPLLPTTPRKTPIIMLGQNARFQHAVLQVASFFAVSLGMLGLQLLRQQTILSGPLKDQLAVVDPRKPDSMLQAQRGTIYAGQRIVAASEAIDSGPYFRRVYPEANFSYLGGYFNPYVFPLTRLEEAYDDYLSGRFDHGAFDELLHRPLIGADLHLTLDPDLQDAAQQLLGERKGAVVMLDSQSGAILALASWPNFDPQQLSFDPSAPKWSVESARAISYYNTLTADPYSGVLLLRSTQGLYAPGSTFKTVTAAAALDIAAAQPTSVYTDAGGVIRLTAGNYAHVDCDGCRPPAHGDQFTMTEAYGFSLNVVFAQIGTQLGPNHLQDYARRFGFGLHYDSLGEPVATSTLFSEHGALLDTNTLAATAYGQGQILATPLQMALVAATIARGGELPAPYLVESITDPSSGRTLARAQPRTIQRAISERTAAAMRTMMVASVEQGHAAPAAIPAYVVGGKTGTAETGHDSLPHAWFTGWAGPTIDQARYAVAVIIENGGDGSTVALPVGRAMLALALGVHP